MPLESLGIPGTGDGLGWGVSCMSQMKLRFHSFFRGLCLSVCPQLALFMGHFARLNAESVAHFNVHNTTGPSNWWVF